MPHRWLPLLCIGILCLAACDSSPNERVDIPPGAYDEFGVRDIVDGAVVSEGLAGVFLRRRLLFDGPQQLTITVVSDFGPETGEARGRYTIEDGALMITFTESTTSLYEPGDTLRYEDVDVVDSSFRTTFTIDENPVVFEGPGLVLTQNRLDENDADDDGNTQETLQSMQYFEHSE